MSRIITVSREFGGGGRELGRRIAETLHIAYYDREIIAELSKRTGLMEETVEHSMERNPVLLFPIDNGVTFRLPTGGLLRQQGKSFAEQCKIIRALAEKSDCVIVGRCADYILADQKPYCIFTYSDMESKIRRCRLKGQEGRELTDHGLKHRIQAINKGRAEYYNFFTG